MNRQKVIVDPFVPRPKLTVQKPRQATVPMLSKDKSEPAPVKSARRYAKFRTPRMQMIGLLLAAVVIGFLMPVQILGELVVGVYALCVLIFKIKSKISFILACLMLVFVMVLLIIQPSNVMAMAFATYVFLLLIIGTISLAVETRRGEHERPKRPGLHLNDQD